jgi:hypothetical protein
VRERFLMGAKPYFRIVIPVKTPMRVLSVMLSVLIFDAPLPMNEGVLKQSIVDSARRALLPLKAERSRAAPASPEVPAAPRATETLEPRIEDFFAPAPEGRRRRARPAPAAAVETPPPTPAPSIVIAPELHLREYTGDNTTFTPAALSADRVYEVVFGNGPPGLQKVRFSEKAIKWLNEHPPQARGIVRALCLGSSNDYTFGIKKLVWRSRRYGGQLFELKVESDHRPYVIFDKDRQEWQVISIPHKDDQFRAARTVRPIDQI